MLTESGFEPQYVVYCSLRWPALYLWAIESMLVCFIIFFVSSVFEIRMLRFNFLSFSQISRKLNKISRKFYIKLFYRKSNFQKNCITPKHLKQTGKKYSLSIFSDFLLLVWAKIDKISFINQPFCFQNRTD